MQGKPVWILLVLGLLSGCAGYGHHARMHDGTPGMGQGGMMDGQAMGEGGMMGSVYFRQGLLVAQGGRTLYRFDRDQAGSGASACNGECAVKWPPYLAAPGATAQGPLGLATRADGSKQWTFNGWPLYFWQGDQKAGDSSGDNVGGVWHVIRP